MIEHPEDFASAPIGAGEPYTPPKPADLRPSEALYGFAGWLSCRDKAVTLGAAHEASTAADLVDAYCRSQGLEPPRHDFDLRLRPGPSA